MAGFSFEFQVRLDGDDEARAVTAGPPDLIRLERKYGIGANDLANSPRIEWLAFMAWSALRRREPGSHPDFEAFLDRIVDLEVETPQEQPEGEASGPEGASPGS